MMTLKIPFPIKKKIKKYNNERENLDTIKN